MSVNKFRLSDYDNPVAEAVKKIGGVKRAAKKLCKGECVVEQSVRRGYLRYRREAVTLNIHTDVPEEDLLRSPE